MIGFVLLYCFYDARHPAAVNWLVVGAVVVVAGIFLVLCGRVKKVSTYGNGSTLIVSNFLKECLVKKTDICEIKIKGAKKRFVNLRLKGRCVFGDTIIFIPPFSVLIKGDKYIHEFIHEHLSVKRQETYQDTGQTGNERRNVVEG
jgi:hypothetical protein